MEKLQALTDHLRKVCKVGKPEQLRGVMESGETQPSFEQAGPDLLLYRHRYTARIVFEKTPHDIGHVVACAVAWMEEHGQTDSSAWPDKVLGWEGEPVDTKLGDLDIRVQFEEEQHYVPKPVPYTGRDVVPWRGVDYVPGAAVAAKAATLDLAGAVE